MMRTTFRALTLTLVLLIMLPIALLYSAVSVKAEPDPNITPTKYAKIYQAGRVLIRCDEVSDGLYASKAPKDIDTGEIFEGSESGSDLVYPGWLVDTIDGRTSCYTGDEIVRATAVFEKPLSKLLVDMGVYKVEPNDYVVDRDKGRRREAIKKYIKDNYGIDVGSNGTMSEPAQYVALRTTFNKVCKGNKLSEAEAKRLPSDSVLQITVVDEKGGVKTEYWGEKTDTGQFVGYGIQNDGGSDGVMNCTAIAEGMRHRASSYKDRVIDLINKNVNVDQDIDSSLSSDNNPTCETTPNPLSWIMCPLINGLGDLADFMFEKIIQPLLVSRDIGYTDPNEGIFEAWSSFRSLANILLFIAVLVVVFGQTIGGGLVDAYTVKKAVPRILAAAILINISIYLVAFLLDVTNVIGAGIQSLIYAPFDKAGQFRLQPGNLSSVGIIGGLLFGGKLFSIVALAKVMPFILLMVVLTAVLAFIGIFITLIIRQGIIILLVLVSPLAFMAFVLPNTEKFFKQWWGLLSKTLLVYPIVMIIMAIADVLSATLSGTFPMAVQWIADIISIFLLIIPLFLIPFAFKLAGGAIGSLYGAISGFNKRGANFIKGDPRDPNSNISRAKKKALSGLNDSNLSGAAIGTRLNPFIRGDRRRSRLSSIRATNRALLGEDSAQARLMAKALQDDKVGIDLATFASSEDSRAAIEFEAEASRQELLRQYNNPTPGSTPMTLAELDASMQEIEIKRQQKLIASETADRIGRTTANRRAALMHASTIGYGLTDGEEGWGQAVGIMRDISAGDESEFRSMVNEFQAFAKQAGRHDLAGNVDSDEYNGDRAWGGGSLYIHANGKPAAIKGFGKWYARKFSQPGASDSDKQDAAVFYKELEQMIPNATGAVRDALVEERDRLQALGMDTYLDTEVSSETRRVAVRDPADPNNFIWEDQEVKTTLGQALSAGAIPGKRVRGYERPDPDRLNTGP